MKETRIEIIALTERGRKSLALQKADEIALRKKYSVREGASLGERFHALRTIPLNVRSYLKTVSLFMPKDGDPERHEILGFKKMGDVARMQFYQGVKKSFKENGCDLNDFEVKFHDK